MLSLVFEESFIIAKKMCKTILILLLYTLFESCAGRFSTVPVLLIDHNNVMNQMAVLQSPFRQINSSLFSEIALNALRRSDCVILFIEEYLSVEDLRSKDVNGTPYQHLREGINGTEVIFLPSVIEPYEVLTKVFEPHISNIFHLGEGGMPHLLEQHKFCYVFLKESKEETRVEKLRNHDELMKEVYYNVKLMKSGPVVAFYTGKMNPIVPSKVLRQTPPEEPQQPKGSLVSTPQAIYLFTLTFVKNRDTSIITAYPDIKEEVRTRYTISTTMLINDFQLQFNFHLGENNWKLESIVLKEAGTEVGRTSTSILAPWYRSYYCNELCDMPITIYNIRNKSTFIMYEYQFEPKRHPAMGVDATTKVILDWDTKSAGVFNHSVQCCPYFNKAILSGLVVGFVFVGIAFFGILMLFSCKVGDQYDDPTKDHFVIPSEAGPVGWDKHK